jgi:succinate dehydrogenase/fumarate reductase flavoprotein subunit
LHYLDVMGGGHYKNDPELVKALVMDAPEVLAWLEQLGVMFDKEPDGTMITIHGGGTSRKRMHAARDYSGGEIMKTLKDEVLNRQVPLLEFTAAYELLTDGDKVTGAVLYNMETDEYMVVKAKTVILATGGGGRLHVTGFPTSNHYGATADGLVLGYRAGAPLLYMDTIQYHPTGAAYPEQILGLLVTEKVRSIGGQITNAEGNRFVYELETRDVEAAAIIRECEGRKCTARARSGHVSPRCIVSTRGSGST